MQTSFPYFLVPLAVGLIVQGLKIIIDILVERTVKLDYLRRSGGFPSVHGAVIGSIMTLSGVLEGIDSLAFAICFAIGILIWYDAVNIRQEAGKHARVLNEMRKQLGELSIDLGEITHIRKNFNLLKERLGHSVRELFGGIIIGIIITLVALYLFTNYLGI